MHNYITKVEKSYAKAAGILDALGREELPVLIRSERKKYPLRSYSYRTQMPSNYYSNPGREEAQFCHEAEASLCSWSPQQPQES